MRFFRRPVVAPSTLNVKEAETALFELLGKRKDQRNKKGGTTTSSSSTTTSSCCTDGSSHDGTTTGGGGTSNGTDTDENDNTDFNNNNMYETIRKLIECHSSIVDAMNEEGYTPLQVLCSNPNINVASNLKIVKLFVETSSELFWRKENEKNNTTTTNNRKKIKNGGGKGNELLSPDDDEPTSFILPSSAIAVRQRTNHDGRMALHIACLHGGYIGMDVIEYLIHSHPAAVCTPDSRSQNLPLHDACTACTMYTVPILLLVQLVQQWPASCQEMNHDGNLPLHIAVQITKGKLKQNQNQQSSCSTNSQQQQEEEEINQQQQQQQQRYDAQLDIVHYLTNYYPKALFIANHRGQTPLQIAIVTMRECILSTHPIVDFLNEFIQQYQSTILIHQQPAPAPAPVMPIIPPQPPIPLIPTTVVGTVSPHSPPLQNHTTETSTEPLSFTCHNEGEDGCSSSPSKENKRRSFRTAISGITMDPWIMTDDDEEEQQEEDEEQENNNNHDDNHSPHLTETSTSSPSIRQDSKLVLSAHKEHDHTFSTSPELSSAIIDVEVEDSYQQSATVPIQQHMHDNNSAHTTQSAIMEHNPYCEQLAPVTPTLRRKESKTPDQMMASTSPKAFSSRRLTSPSQSAHNKNGLYSRNISWKNHNSQKSLYSTSSQGSGMKYNFASYVPGEENDTTTDCNDGSSRRISSGTPISSLPLLTQDSNSTHESGEITWKPLSDTDDEVEEVSQPTSENCTTTTSVGSMQHTQMTQLQDTNQVLIGHDDHDDEFEDDDPIEIKSTHAPRPRITLDSYSSSEGEEDDDFHLGSEEFEPSENNKQKNQHDERILSSVTHFNGLSTTEHSESNQENNEGGGKGNDIDSKDGDDHDDDEDGDNYVFEDDVGFSRGVFSKKSGYLADSSIAVSPWKRKQSFRRAKSMSRRNDPLAAISALDDCSIFEDNNNNDDDGASVTSFLNSSCLLSELNKRETNTNRVKNDYQFNIIGVVSEESENDETCNEISDDYTYAGGDMSVIPTNEEDWNGISNNQIVEIDTMGKNPSTAEHSPPLESQQKKKGNGLTNKLKQITPWMKETIIDETQGTIEDEQDDGRNSSDNNDSDDDDDDLYTSIPVSKQEPDQSEDDFRYEFQDRRFETENVSSEQIHAMASIHVDEETERCSNKKIFEKVNPFHHIDDETEKCCNRKKINEGTLLRNGVNSGIKASETLTKSPIKAMGRVVMHSHDELNLSDPTNRHNKQGLMQVIKNSGAKTAGLGHKTAEILLKSGTNVKRLVTGPFNHHNDDQENINRFFALDQVEPIGSDNRSIRDVNKPDRNPSAFLKGLRNEADEPTSYTLRRIPPLGLQRSRSQSSGISAESMNSNVTSQSLERKGFGKMLRRGSAGHYMRNLSNDSIDPVEQQYNKNNFNHAHFASLTDESTIQSQDSSHGHSLKSDPSYMSITSSEQKRTGRMNRRGSTGHAGQITVNSKMQRRASVGAQFVPPTDTVPYEYQHDSQFEITRELSSNRKTLSTATSQSHEGMENCDSSFDQAPSFHQESTSTSHTKSYVPENAKCFQDIALDLENENNDPEPSTPQGVNNVIRDGSVHDNDSSNVKSKSHSPLKSPHRKLPRKMIEPNTPQRIRVKNLIPIEQCIEI